MANKYLIAFLIFSVWMIFLDEHNILFLRQNINKIKRYRAEIEYYNKKIEDDSQRLKDLKASSRDLEKFAREEFFMKRKNEDIFLIIERE